MLLGLHADCQQILPSAVMLLYMSLASLRMSSHPKLWKELSVTVYLILTYDYAWESLSLYLGQHVVHWI